MGKPMRWTLGRGILLPNGAGVWGESCTPSRKFFQFLLGNDAFWELVLMLV